MLSNTQNQVWIKMLRALANVSVAFTLLAGCQGSETNAPPAATAETQPETAVPEQPAATAVPHTTAPTPTPPPKPTLTAAQLRDQRATAVLTTLPGYNPAYHEALLPLARHLWGESDLVDSADVTVVVGETAVRAAVQVALRVNADASQLQPGERIEVVLGFPPDQPEIQNNFMRELSQFAQSVANAEQFDPLDIHYFRLVRLHRYD